ncbi:MAG: type II toxin-antitoxin system HicB family antitoxin [Chloroflexales bacterium]|nr:type II toxin-antitoxin system HicB family antitoxin [Chloroflexales bacterium]
MRFTIETEQEADARWIAEILELSGVLAYGATREEAIARAQALALRVIAERLEHDEEPAQLLNIAFEAAAA